MYIHVRKCELKLGKNLEKRRKKKRVEGLISLI